MDAEGNQLPYMDGIRSEVVQDKETLTTRALMGEFDYLGERASLKKLPLMKEKEAGGAIKVLIPRMHRLPIDFKLNLTVADPTWRAVTGDVRFRRALSLAINRPEILKNFYLNQFAKLPSRSSSAEYSVDKANALLDEMGMEKRAATGSGPRPMASPSASSSRPPTTRKTMCRCPSSLPSTGRRWALTRVSRGWTGALRGNRWNANELQATAGWAHETIWPSTGWDDYLPGNNWGRLWHQWWTSGGKRARSRPRTIKDLYDTHMKFMNAKSGSPESKAALDAIYKSYLDNVWTFPVVED